MNLYTGTDWRWCALRTKEGFRISKKGSFLAEHNNQAGRFTLLARDEQVEVILLNISPERSIVCLPEEAVDSLNTIYVIKGRLFHTNTESFVEEGEVITFKNITDIQHLSVLEKTTIYWTRPNHLFEEQNGSIDELYSIMNSIQIKDQYTAEHCNRTGNLAAQIAVLMKLNSQEIQTLFFASKIHDLGKKELDITLLNQKRKLTHLEFEEVKRHSRLGSEMVFKQLGDKRIAKVVLDHHEKIDGSGYPNSLKGDEISIEARILVVADCYDAMTSDRPYRVAMTKEEALKEINAKSGIYYDKKVVKALEKVLTFPIY